LRKELAVAEADSASLTEIRAQLEGKLKELQKARLTEAEHAQASRHLVRKGVLFGMCAVVTLGAGIVALRQHLQTRAPAPRRPSVPATAAAWFKQIRPHCNPVEVATTVRSQPPPTGALGAAYLAICHALAGKTEVARGLLDDLPQPERQQAVNLLFGIADTVADSGDNEAAAPMMELVLVYVPDHPQALYHAGMAQIATGKPEQGAWRLRRFLALYTAEDGWRHKAKATLAESALRRLSANNAQPILWRCYVLKRRLAPTTDAAHRPLQQPPTPTLTA
jgi:hypothetical protein